MRLKLGAPVRCATCANVYRYGISRVRAASAARAHSSACGPNSHGSRRPAFSAEWVRNERAKWQP